MPPTAPNKLTGVDSLEAVFALLARYVSAPTAQSIVNVARQRARATTGRPDQVRLDEMRESIEHNIRLFLQDKSKVEECCRGLRALTAGTGAPAAATPATVVVGVRQEADIVQARVEARQLALALSFSPAGQTRLVTAVSELARNIVQYAGEGQITLAPCSSPQGIEVVAKDRGPGIPNLEDIMAGNYKSRLGMGLGLRGIKRLAERFEIQTGSGRGTTVTVVLKMA